MGRDDGAHECPSNVTVDSNSYSFSFAKGPASISWAETTTVVTVVINGKTYAVAREVAMALARGTQFGASSVVEVDGTLLLPGSGYTTTPVAASKSGSRQAAFAPVSRVKRLR